jgi:hypothetical protein
MAQLKCDSSKLIISWEEPIKRLYRLLKNLSIDPGP